MMKLTNMNKTHYNLIYSKSEIQKFFSKLPILTTDEIYSAVLFCRKKYATDEQRQSLKFGDNAAFDRKLVKGNDPDKFYNTLQRYNIPLGAYTDPNGNEIPENVLALYMTTNPRCCKKATKELVHEIIEGNFQNNYDFTSVESQFKNKIQKFASRKVLVDIDIDTKENNILGNVLTTIEGIGVKPTMVIETKNGYHVLVNIEELSSAEKNWYRIFQTDICVYWQNKLHKETIVEIKTDTMCPIPGTLQGGFEVKIL